MRTWQRAGMARWCGRCGKGIASGAPMVVITFASSSAKVYRCAACEGPAPDDLPDPITETKQRVGALLRSTSTDWKLRQAKE